MLVQFLRRRGASKLLFCWRTLLISTFPCSTDQVLSDFNPRCELKMTQKLSRMFFVFKQLARAALSAILDGVGELAGLTSCVVELKNLFVIRQRRNIEIKSFPNGMHKKTLATWNTGPLFKENSTKWCNIFKVLKRSSMLLSAVWDKNCTLFAFAITYSNCNIFLLF